MPVMYDRYPGTSGSTQGDRNVTAPAAAATGIASSSGPEETRLPMLTTVLLPPSRFRRRELRSRPIAAI
jgi:hypothetical protein